MQHAVPQRRNARALLAAGVGVISGLISAVLVEPVAETTENIAFLQDTLVGLLSILALSSGLVFGIVGGLFGRWRLGFDWLHSAIWFVASVVGMGAAFYVAILTFDRETATYIVPYLSASPVGALVLGGAIVAFRPFAAKLKLLASLLVAPTIWAVGVGVALLNATSDDAMSVPWLIALFCGWQAIFLAILAWWRRV